MTSQHERDDNWHFDDGGTFVLENPHRTSYLYFPLVNEAGMMSAITPLLHGDVKTGQNTFLTPPVSVEDLRDSRSARNSGFSWTALARGPRRGTRRHRWPTALWMTAPNRSRWRRGFSGTR